MVHKLLNKDEWEEDWEVTEKSLRDTCLEKGVHPVWHDLAQRTAVLAQFAAFPKAKVSKAKAGKKVKLEYGRPSLCSKRAALSHFRA